MKNGCNKGLHVPQSINLQDTLGVQEKKKKKKRILVTSQENSERTKKIFLEAKTPESIDIKYIS